MFLILTVYCYSNLGSGTLSQQQSLPKYCPSVVYAFDIMINKVTSIQYVIGINANPNRIKKHSVTYLLGANGAKKFPFRCKLEYTLCRIETYTMPFVSIAMQQEWPKCFSPKEWEEVRSAFITSILEPRPLVLLQNTFPLVGWIATPALLKKNLMMLHAMKKR